MKKLLVILAVLALASAASAEVLVSYTFTGSVPTPAAIGTAIQTASSIGISPQTGFSYLSTGGAPNPPGVGTAGWSAGTPTAYWSFSLSCMSGYTFADSPDTLTFGFAYRATTTGPVSWQLDADTGAGFSTVASGALTANGTWLSVSGQDVSEIAGASSASFRLYGYGAPSATGTWTVDTINLNGTTTAVPEPATMSLLGLGALAMVLRRKMSK